MMINLAKNTKYIDKLYCETAVFASANSLWDKREEWTAIESGCDLA